MNKETGEHLYTRYTSYVSSEQNSKPVTNKHVQNV